ncbi:nitronate monooxygenase family protein [Sporosarcina sp. P1]|uniref:NAD(P)H-dependent flavin oxidoreductase n=1 Tax=Sporosarcina sp. P1 TaxID=2048257 RepID=UPI000C16EFDC|nr:nitronate monooxygenase [Sporosarcina sp. P1]PIC83000.1 nitronate monooxygenase [Sporosarcina sp. P1]
MNNRLPASITDHTVLPMIASPMFLVTGPELVLACCKSGVISAFPSPNARTIEVLDEWMTTITAELEKAKAENPHQTIAPWAANILIKSKAHSLEDQLRLIVKHKAPIVITGLGSPAEVVDVVHGYGGLVFADVASVKHAKKAAEAGVDGLILISSGAGGHTGTIAGFAFVDAVREFWDGILVLAGSISTGRGILAAQTLGADLAYIGSKFIAATESMACDEYREMLLDSSVEDVVYTNAVTGVHANMLKPSLQRAGFDLENLTFDKSEGRPKAWRDVWSAGHGVGTIRKIQSASDIISELRTEYEEAVERAQQPNPWAEKILMK